MEETILTLMEEEDLLLTLISPEAIKDAETKDKLKINSRKSR